MKVFAEKLVWALPASDSYQDAPAINWSDAIYIWDIYSRLSYIKSYVFNISRSDFCTVCQAFWFTHMAVAGSAVWNAVRNWYTSKDASPIHQTDRSIVTLGLLAIIQIVYAMIRGSTFPFNSLLSGISACVGLGSLMFCYRVFSTEPSAFPVMSREEFLTDLALAAIVITIGCINFVG